MHNTPEMRLPGAGERSNICKSIISHSSTPAQFGFFPSKGIDGSAMQPISETIYRYIASNRSSDQTSTKQWRARMRGLRFQKFQPADWSYEKFGLQPSDDGHVTVLADDGNYYRLHERDLKPEVSLVDLPTEELTSAVDEVWQGEVAE